ncbi:MAG: RnfABCDGE type electron transport complex subunit D, partial [Immundisolibacteraceae bacterium]|nr:RnfABCDGE type electron transport complex subunit D [Immundisolibacteraceae bacterium]
MNLSSSPHLQGNASVGRTMIMVLLALIPVISVSVWLFGSTVLMQLLVAGLTGLLAEALVMLLRGRSVTLALLDGSALVTALLLALCLPPTAPLWVVIVGVLFAIVVVKHLYGGLGYNLFNPAMAGYLVV